MKSIFKKILIIFALIGFSSIALPLNTIAADDKPTSDIRCESFLGLESWNCGITEMKSEQDLKSNIWLIASNIAKDITVIATYLVLGYVIYGGYLYIFSGGDPAKISNGRKTLTNAFIGLAITMSASIIMGSIRFALIGASGNLTECASGTDACVTAEGLIQNLVNWFIGIAGLVSVIFLVYGGILYITSAGSPDKATKARQMILYSLIGLIIVGLSFAISAFVSNLIREANENAYINQTIISKEDNEIKAI